MSRERRTFPDDRIDSALRFIAAHAREHGCAPTIREIGKAVGYASPSTVHLLVKNMYTRGFIEMYLDTPRSIHLTGDGYERISETFKHPLHREILNLLPAAMAYWSEELFAAGWLAGLDRELPKMIPEISDAAKAVGKIPVSYNGEAVEWRPYPDEMD
jgi:repressor LexA